MRLTDFKALTFDAYGTLIDWESGMVEGLKPLTGKVEKSLSGDDILEAHAYHESTTQRQTPAKRYSDILATVYKRLAEARCVQPGSMAAKLRPRSSTCIIKDRPIPPCREVSSTQSALINNQP